MKKTITTTLKLMFSLLSIFLLVACAKSETKEEASYFQKIDKTTKSDSRLTYYHKGDDVVHQTAENTVYYSAFGTNDKNVVKEQLEPVSALYANKKGVTHTIDYQDEKLVETLEIDYTKVDFSELKNIPGMIFESNAKDVKKISFKSSTALLEQNGFKKVQDGKFESLD
ncbi:hypothetical protein BU202_07065 [Streptococcus cuniculi]|uniref:DUF1307 domain-containing protein n=1 Tax=Streptococcus cuniculi TaxID=1432788 RepID=A0A1Q8E6J8_9STRE|nr:YehR family protein [Streptococcus cuniculi]OLF47417.1 hypothetical protein BU202_07065 [Streptococcus cuniculi]